jgi:hypothetical protein
VSEDVPPNAGESLNADAARALALLMSETSEECWCAGWLADCEYSLWRMCANPATPLDWGMSEVEAKDVDEMRRLSKECGGWITWDRDKGVEWFVPLTEWERVFAEYEQTMAAWAEGV